MRHKKPHPVFARLERVRQVDRKFLSPYSVNICWKIHTAASLIDEAYSFRAIVSVRANFSDYFTIRTYFIYLFSTVTFPKHPH